MSQNESQIQGQRESQNQIQIQSEFEQQLESEPESGSVGYLALAFWMPEARLAALRSKTSLMSSWSSSLSRPNIVSRL